MRRILSFKDKSLLHDRLYKGLYITPLVLDEKYCRFLDWYEDNIQLAISELCDYINEKYEKDLRVKLNKNIQPGLIAFETVNIREIAEDIHEFLNDRDIENRVVYAEGTVTHFDEDIHKCDTRYGTKGTLLPLIGRLTDKLKGKAGIFSALVDKTLNKDEIH